MADHIPPTKEPTEDSDRFNRLSGEQKDAALDCMLERIAACGSNLLDPQNGNNLVAEIVRSGAPNVAEIFIRRAQKKRGPELAQAIQKCLAQRPRSPIGPLIRAARKCGANLKPWVLDTPPEQQKGDAPDAANTSEPELTRDDQERESPNEAPVIGAESFVPEPHICVHCKLDPPDGTERALDDGTWIHARCEAAFTARMAEEDIAQEDASSLQTPELNDSHVAAKFLEKLRPGGFWALTAIVPDGKNTTVAAHTTDQVESFVREHNDKRNLYYSVNPTRTPLNKKAAKTDIAAIEFILTDCGSDPPQGKD